MIASDERGEIPARGWVLYDASCGFCRKWVPAFEEVLARRGFGIAPLQADWVRELLELDDGELLADVRLFGADGEQVVGPDVYRRCMRRIWWAWPLWLLSVLPGSRRLFNWCYRTFARNRYCVSSALRWQETDRAT